VQAFRDVGIRTGENGTLHVIITGEYTHNELREINREMLEKKCPWMLVKPVGTELWIGPLFLPGTTGCWECLKQRLDLNCQLTVFYQTQRQTDAPLPIPAAYTPFSLQLAANHTAIETVKWLYFGTNEQIEGKLITIDARALRTQSHVLVKRPQCHTCRQGATPSLNSPVPLSSLDLKMVRCFRERNVPTPMVLSGGYREVAPEETFRRYRHHISPITGIVQSLRPYFSEEGMPIYNYSSGRNIALKSQTLFWLNSHLRSANGGKGKNWTQAKTGALCEAIERYSGTYQGDELVTRNSLEKLGEQGIHPNACMNYSEKQYQNRKELNRACPKFYFLVPRPFDESLEMDWTPLYSLTEGTFKYLPSCFCYAQYPAEDEWNLFAYPDSNGGAAGNSIEEAILQGFLELVERDSVAIWWYNRLRRPAVDLLSFNEPYFRQVINYYKILKRALYVLDLTSDFGIPTFGAFSYRLDGPRPDIFFGFGAHVDAGIAIERAVIELNQILPVVNVPEEERLKDNYRIKDQSFIQWLKTATLENQPYLVPLDDPPIRTAADYAPLCEPTIGDSVTFCVETAARVGLETLVLDLTRPDIEMPVVKVVVPGMRHFWQRLAPGRLYDVPVKMGELKTPLKEDELNPIALFI
jgi:ribosomal protein S12 methylthiotransferase accessory factor